MKPCPSRSVLLLATLIAAAFAAPAWAGDTPNVIAVTTTSDAMDAFDQQCSLREALANANTNTQYSPVVNECPAGSDTATDEIQLQSGTSYTLSLPGNDDVSGDLNVLDDPSLAAGQLDVHITITGGNDNAAITQQVAGQRVLHSDGADLAISGATLRGGATADVGGGIYNDGGSLTLTAVALTDNEAVSGGGLYSDGDATLDDVGISDNNADLIGGGVFHKTGTLYVTRSYIGSNSASSGAGIYASSGTTTLEDVSVNINTASNDGGGIMSTGTSALTLTNVEVEANTAQGSGGGINSTSSSEILLNDSDFIGNEAGSLGGAVRAAGSTLVIDGGLFASNVATNLGGALHAGYIEASGTHFDGNSTNGWGGAIYGSITCDFDDSIASGNAAHDGGAIVCQILRMTGSRLSNNTAARYGGGAYVSNHVEIHESALVANGAGDAGGGLWFTPGNSDGFMTRTLIEGNSAANDGGGVWLGADEHVLLVANSTFSGNAATGGEGGGLFVDGGATAFAYGTTFADNGPSESIAKYGELTLQNSIITSPGIDCVVALEDPEIISLGHNLSDDDTCIGLDAAGDQMETDPMLAPLANNGGGTRTHALLAGSPAIDAADTDACHGKLAQGVDQRGAPRPQPFGCDIGAHEQEVVLAEIFADGFED